MDRALIEYLATLAPRDKEAARIWWTTHAPRYAAALLDSGALDNLADMPQTREDFLAWYDEFYAGPGRDPDLPPPDRDNSAILWGIGLFAFTVGGLYYLSSGASLPWTTVDEALRQTIANSNDQIDELYDDLASGAIGLDEWRRQMAEYIRQGQIAAAVLQRGGFWSMTDLDWIMVQDSITDQIEALVGLYGRLQSGDTPLDGRLRTWMKMYNWAARATYFMFENEQQASRGATHYENILHANESCAGCIAESSKGIVPIGSLVPIGQRDCLSHCLCTYEYYSETVFEDLGE